MSENNFPEVQFVPRERSALPSHTPMLGMVLSRAEQLGELSLEDYCALSQRRIMSERQKHARWIIRRVLFWAERMRAPVNKKTANWYVPHMHKPGLRVVLDEKRIYNDWRVMRELPLVLRNYGCPEEHLKSVERLIHFRLALKWGVR